MDGKVFFSREIRHSFPLINNMIKVLFLICTLIWRANNCVSRQGRVLIGEIKVQLLLHTLQLLSIGSLFKKSLFDCLNR